VDKSFIPSFFCSGNYRIGIWEKRNLEVDLGILGVFESVKDYFKNISTTRDVCYFEPICETL